MKSPPPHLITDAADGVARALSEMAHELVSEESYFDDDPRRKAQLVRARVLRRVRDELQPAGALRREVEAIIRTSGIELGELECDPDELAKYEAD